MKLLAKNAEERYQTASGVEADLRQCLAGLESYGRIDAFPLGTHDASERLLISEKLYGREPEIAALLTAFDRVMVDGMPALDMVWRESEMAMDFARQAKYGDASDMIGNQQRFIATMQGRTGTFSTFSDTKFDQATFEARLAGDRSSPITCTYWILKLKARYLSATSGWSCWGALLLKLVGRFRPVGGSCQEFAGGFAAVVLRF